MSSVYTFIHSDDDILQELLKIFSNARGTAREQWALEAEILVEPIGWDALWKLSKEFCRKFDVRFPCITLVTVTSVDFEGLSACVELLGVQHENIVLPSNVDDVPLIELWPTIKQREVSVNAATTAEFIDLLRFYYNNLWMPWDDQDDKMVLPNTIVERMGLWSDLHNGKIPGPIALSISSLRSEAIKAHKKLKELDSSICSEDLADEDGNKIWPIINVNGKKIEVREIFKDNVRSSCNITLEICKPVSSAAIGKRRWLVVFAAAAQRARRGCRTNAPRHRIVVALWKGGNVQEFEKISTFLKTKLTNDQILTVMVSAEESLASVPEELVICSDTYEIPDMPLSNISISSYRGSILKASDMRSSLLMVSEECKLRDLSLHCSSVSNVIVVRSGSSHIINCTLLDESKYCQNDLTQGIIALADSKVLIENCSLENFYSGIIVHRGAQVELRNCIITKCGVGIQMYGDAQVTLDHTTIDKCLEQSIRCERHIDDACKETSGIVSGLTIQPNCKIGSGDLQREVVVVEQDIDLI
ncbi:Protein nessun dorma [Eumeta japonica]|uniref:Protein nessun dorma n=1 Tax=Eumeta variegata TaxID=151549 RepID=A0A4C1SF00_EUMVA|nr:Protein nessun dorma [Eumeta japonica]